MSIYPLIQGFDADAVFAWRRGKPVTVDQFLGEIAALAAALPPRAHVINLCASRYHFTVGLAAAMMRGQISLLPPSDTPGTLAQLAEDYPDVYCLADRPVTCSAITVMAFPDIVPIAGLKPEIPSFPAGQMAALLFTSGSTGRPKPQAKTWGGFVRSTLAAGARLNVSALPGATLIGTVPHQHSYGIESTVLLALQHGLTLHDTKPLLPADIADALAGVPGPRILITAPIHLKALLTDNAAVPKTDLIVSATAPLSPQMAREAEARFAAPLYEIYGCSEAGQLATRRTATTSQWHCFDGITLRQDDRGSWAQGDAVGDETLLSDIIELFDNTHFLLHGRTADLVNIAGKRSSLAHLNFHLNSIPGVVDGAFVMQEGTERLTAFVVAPGLSSETILAALRQHIDPAFLPRPLHLVDALPRNDLGKLPRDLLLAAKA
jgi:acyl-coenzyme A synthetase/AMP-(fatty) acid ligase